MYSINFYISFHVECDVLIVVMSSGKENQGQSNSQGDASQVNGLQTEELAQLREEVEELRKQHTLLQTQLGDKDALINTLVSTRLRTLSKCVGQEVMPHWGFHQIKNEEQCCSKTELLSGGADFITTSVCVCVHLCLCLFV